MTQFVVKLAGAKSEYEKFELQLGAGGRDAGKWVYHFFSANLQIFQLLNKSENDSTTGEAKGAQILHTRFLLERIPELPAFEEEEWGMVRMALEIFSCNEARELFESGSALEVNYNSLVDMYRSHEYESFLDQMIRAIEKRKDVIAEAGQ